MPYSERSTAAGAAGRCSASRSPEGAERVSPAKLASMFRFLEHSQGICGTPLSPHYNPCSHPAICQKSAIMCLEAHALGVPLVQPSTIRQLVSLSSPLAILSPIRPPLECSILMPQVRSPAFLHTHYCHLHYVSVPVINHGWNPARD